MQGSPLAEAVRRSSGGSRSSAATVSVYASSPNPDRIDAHVDEVLAEGHRAIKLKVGFELARDEALVAGVRERAGEDVELMIDANQSWDVEEAEEAITRLARHDLRFVEEPIAGFSPASDWGALARRVAVPLAGGENIPTLEALRVLAEAGGVGVFQPSITKFGGVSGWIETTALARAQGIAVCPHYMGTGLGLAASLQMLALVEGSERHELDSNDNPLRTELGPLDLSLEDGRVAVPGGPGVGFEPEPDPWIVPDGRGQATA